MPRRPSQSAASDLGHRVPNLHPQRKPNPPHSLNSAAAELVQSADVPTKLVQPVDGKREQAANIVTPP